MISFCMVIISLLIKNRKILVSTIKFIKCFPRFGFSKTVFSFCFCWAFINFRELYSCSVSDFYHYVICEMFSSLRLFFKFPLLRFLNVISRVLLYICQVLFVNSVFLKKKKTFSWTPFIVPNQYLPFTRAWFLFQKV